MRRSLSRACLLVALITPFVCQAEAAEALSRSLAELTERAVLDPADPSDGDGSHVSSIQAEAHPGPGELHVSDAPCDASAWETPPRSSSLPGPEDPGGPAGGPWASAPAPRRQARLQVFRF